MLSQLTWSNALYTSTSFLTTSETQTETSAKPLRQVQLCPCTVLPKCMQTASAAHLAKMLLFPPYNLPNARTTVALSTDCDGRVIAREGPIARPRTRSPRPRRGARRVAPFVYGTTQYSAGWPLSAPHIPAHWSIVVIVLAAPGEKGDSERCDMMSMSPLVLLLAAAFAIAGAVNSSTPVSRPSCGHVAASWHDLLATGWMTRSCYAGAGSAQGLPQPGSAVLLLARYSSLPVERSSKFRDIA